MNQITISIDQNGTLEFIAHESLAALLDEGKATKTRASHVYPAGFFRRQLFWFLRWATGEQGFISDWTRRWNCLWAVQIVDGPYLGTYPVRADAIAAEVAWIEANRFGA